MSAGKLTPQEAAEMAVAERGLGAGGDNYSAAVRAIELFEASRKRVQLTPEQAKAFEERVETLEAYLRQAGETFSTTAEFTRQYTKRASVRISVDSILYPAELRQLATVCEALADNLERFPS